MGLGVIDPKLSGDRLVPGTVHIYDEEERQRQQTEGAASRSLKRHGDVVLFPQPTNNPNDPLNWPTWKKDAALLSFCFATGLNEAFAVLFSPITGILVEEYHISFNSAAELQGYPLIMTAVGAIFFSAFSRVFGKRSGYLFGALLSLATTIWVAEAKTFHSLLAARIVFGIAEGAFNSLPISSIGDMYYVHQRGSRVMIYTLFGIGCVCVSPIIGGYIANQHGWKMLFKIGAGLAGLQVLLIFFLVPESTFIRPAMYETDVASEEHLMNEKFASDSVEQVKEGSHVETRATGSDSSATEEKKHSFAYELAPFHGIYYHENFLKLLVRPFVCMLYPAIWLGFLSIGVYGTWAVGTAVTLAQVFSVPPALFDPAQLGYTYAFAAVGAILAFLIGSFSLDPISKMAARRNNGFMEPEFRFILNILMYLVGIPGLFGFGYYASTMSPRWVVASVLWGLIAFSYILSSCISYSYVLDCHRDYAVEMTVALTTLRCAFGFGSTYFLPTWLEASGTRHAFYTMGGIECGIFVVAGLGYVFGKQLREAVHRHSPLKMLGVA